MTNSGAAIIAFILAAFFFILGMASGFYVLLALAALSAILGVVAAMRTVTTSTCPACKSNIPKSATICGSCRTPIPNGESR